MKFARTELRRDGKSRPQKRRSKAIEDDSNLSIARGIAEKAAQLSFCIFSGEAPGPIPGK